MRRKVREPENVPAFESSDFKNQIIKDILYQIDYQTALRHDVVNVNEEEMADALLKLPTSILISWYLAYLFIRKELMYSGYELNGLKVLDKPLDTINDLMKKDSNTLHSPSRRLLLPGLWVTAKPGRHPYLSPAGLYSAVQGQQLARWRLMLQLA